MAKNGPIRSAAGKAPLDPEPASAVEHLQRQGEEGRADPRIISASNWTELHIRYDGRHPDSPAVLRRRSVRLSEERTPIMTMTSALRASPDEEKAASRSVRRASANLGRRSPARVKATTLPEIIQ